MKNLFSVKSLVTLITLVSALSVQAASDNKAEAMRMQVVDMQEDVAMLTKQVGQMQLELEAMAHENKDLHQKMNQLQMARNEFETHIKTSVNESKTQVSELKKSWAETIERYKSDVLAQVTQQINKLSDRTHHAMEALARSVSRESGATSQPSVFGEDYPKEGIVYVIQKGDTLSHIAVKHNSGVEDIQNANRIADARNLRPGQTLFIPQKKH